MKKDPVIFLQHILESIEAIETYLQRVSQEAFHGLPEKQDSVVRRLEIIGEATKNLPEDFRKKYPDIPWKRMAGMRDVIIHQYFGINFKRVWETATQLLPLLKNQIKEVLSEYIPEEK